MQEYVGRRYDDEVGRLALARTSARTLRLIRPDAIVTADLRHDRLDIALDGAGIVTALRCG